MQILGWQYGTDRTLIGLIARQYSHQGPDVFFRVIAETDVCRTGRVAGGGPLCACPPLRRPNSGEGYGYSGGHIQFVADIVLVCYVLTSSVIVIFIGYSDSVTSGLLITGLEFRFNGELSQKLWLRGISRLCLLL